MKQIESTFAAVSNALTKAANITDILAIFQRFSDVSDQSQILESLGRVCYVVTAKGEEVQTAFDVVEVDQLLISNMLDGRINTEYPQELQPRDRTRKSSLLQITEMSKNLRPQQLADSGISSHGSPIVGNDLAVESGNGRALAIKKAYAEGRASGYKDYLIKNAAMFGFESSKIAGMNSPILIRYRITKMDRAKFARDSNISDLQSMSASETAYVDAERIDRRLLGLFNPSESGNLLSRSNEPFLSGFLQEVGGSETAGLLTADGRYTKQLIDRVQNAIFAKAYKNEKLVTLMAEEADPEIRNVLTALNNAATSFVEMQYIDGEMHKKQVGQIVDGIEAYQENNTPSLAETALNSLVEAAEIFRNAKFNGQDINEYLQQGSLFGGHSNEAKGLALFIAANNRSAKRMSQAFKLMAEEINKVLVRESSAIGDMFGGDEVDIYQILATVSEQLELDLSGGQSSLF